MKRTALILILALLAAPIAATAETAANPSKAGWRLCPISFAWCLPGGAVLETLWNFLLDPGIPLEVDNGTTMNDGGGWVPYPPVPPPPPHP